LILRKWENVSFSFLSNEKNPFFYITNIKNDIGHMILTIAGRSPAVGPENRSTQETGTSILFRGVMTLCAHLITVFYLIEDTFASQKTF